MANTAKATHTAQNVQEFKGVNLEALRSQVDEMIGKIGEFDNGETRLSRSIGSNGLTLGADYTITALELKEIKNGDSVVNVYPALIFQDGSFISLASLVPPTSLNGFVLESSTKVENTLGYDKDGNKEIEILTSNLLDEAKNPAKHWAPYARTLGGLLEGFKDNQTCIIGKTFKFLGTIYKQAQVRRDSETRRKGDPIAIKAMIFSPVNK